MGLRFSRNEDNGELEVELVSKDEPIIYPNASASELSECLQAANTENFQVHYVMQPDGDYTVNFHKKND
ncbi:hypothetical protein I8751_13275 [Nostocaceae cyanobacterium CENA357]|uniref:Uncharacterized protein n=1 Tax=Atlanticothrix silvestris CENA357 TaxID=1725252 RepID=A0A8J7HBQ7_9CYAN|nr:hypothetical protein [Atlanticothrix silvestris]MBH8553328.1 hypothetical protein [Atlanticothrix silvestris CENA357]